jgi:hypothetical protein
MDGISTQRLTLTPPAGRASGDDGVPDSPAEGGDIDRTWWRHRRVAIGSGYVAIVTATAWLYGVVPLAGRTVPLAPFASVTSWVECLGDGMVTCKYIGYPAGVDLSVGMPLVGGAFLLTRLGIGIEVAINVLSVLAIAAGVAALWAFVASIARSAAAGAFAACLYYLSPILVAHTSKTALWLGFLLLPVPLALAYAALRPNGRPPSIVVGCVGLTFAAALLLVYLDPYAWTLSVVIGGPLCIAAAAMAVTRTGWRGCLVPVCTLIAFLVPGIIFRVLEPSAEVSANFPLGFYRAYGVDVVTAVFPTRDSLLGDLVRSPVDRWDPLDFYADGTPLIGTYIGVVLLIAAIAGTLLLLRRRRSNRLFVIALTVSGLACLALGLGPSLKVLDKASVPVVAVNSAGVVTATNHVMPASDATVTLPWSWVYGLQPFEGMRTAYRWHVGLRLVLAVFAAVAVVWLFRRRRLLGLALAAVLLLETASHGLLDARGQAVHNHELAQAFEDDVDQAFGGGRLRPSERVLFLPAGNDYLIGGIAPPLEIYSYNVAFDKELIRIRPTQPQPIMDAIAAYGNDTLDRDNICTLFSQDIVDAVVFTDFSMRGDTLVWPPPEERIQAQRAKNTAFGVFDDPAFNVDSGDLAVIVRPAPDSLAGCRGPS